MVQTWRERPYNSDVESRVNRMMISAFFAPIGLIPLYSICKDIARNGFQPYLNDIVSFSAFFVIAFCVLGITSGLFAILEAAGLIRLFLANLMRPGRIRTLKQKRQGVIQRIQSTVGETAYRARAIPSPKPHGLEIDMVSESQRADVERLTALDDEIAALEAPQATRS